MSTYQDLVAQKAQLEKQQAELEKQIQAAREAEHSGVVAHIRALMAEHGISVAELGGRGKAGGGVRVRKASSLAGKKVPPKYRNKATGQTWSGRGLQPKWLREALAQGRKLESFSVE
jgi:DNA-binding protein H-NS